MEISGTQSPIASFYGTLYDGNKNEQPENYSQYTVPKTFRGAKD